MEQGAQERGTAAVWAVRLLGVVLALIGLVLLGGGAWLVRLGGSAYYLLAGIGLILSGVLLVRLHLAGAWVYALVFSATVVWAFWEVGLRPWALVPRTVAPLVLLLLVLAALPVLGPKRTDWRAAWGSIAAVLVAAIFVGSMLGWHSAPRVERPLPAASSAAMADPSLDQAGEDWPQYGGTFSARRFSPLAQITPENVSGLERAWEFHTGDLPQSDFAQDKYGAENTPLKIGDTLYVCTPKSIVIALDPAAGTEKWRFDPKVDDKFIPYTAACRGVAYYAVPNAAADSACAARIIWGTLDARLFAVDAKTGMPCADFGSNGWVATDGDMGPITPGLVSMTSAPTIVQGVVVIGHQILDGQKRDAPSGVIKGFDAVTGQLRWGWDMTHPDWTGAPPAGQIYTRGTPNMWTTASGDESLGLVYLPLGNSAVDYWSTLRSEPENQYAVSLVALDVKTGKPRWSFQTVRKDVWDYDLGSQATLLEFPTEGGTVPALVLPSKRGEIFVLDRRTGEPIAGGTEEKPVPGGGVEPEQRAATQPYSRYASLSKPDLTEANMWGMSPVDQMLCRIQFRSAAYKGQFTPPTSRQHSVEYPGYNGGSDWGGVAVDPQRGVIVANYNDMPNYNRLVPRAEADRLGWAPRGEERGGSSSSGAEGAGDPQAGTPYAINVNAGWRLAVTGLLCKEPPYGWIRAIDLKSGKTIWDRPFGTARENGPFGIPSHLPVTIGTPNNGGAVVTASGLVFIAAATDNLIRAIDLKTGETLWQDALPGGGQATPMTYEIGGRQYLVIVPGGHHFMETPLSDAVIAYALPRE